MCREFPQAYSCVAVEEALDPAALPVNGECTGKVGNLTVLLIPSDATSGAAQLSKRWLTEDGAAATILSVTVGAQTLRWGGGRAVVQGPSAVLERALEALTGFTFYESELRCIEQALNEHEAQAHADVARAQVIHIRDRKHWRRMTKSGEFFWRLHLRQTRLAADLAAVPRDLPPEMKTLMAQLLDQADISTRLEAASARLGAHKDFYDSATDRIAERHWFVCSAWLEITIVVLLLIEVALLFVEFYSVYIK